VAAVADGVGAAQLIDQATAVLGRLRGVVVYPARPFGVGDLDRRVQRVAEREEPPAATGDGVGGVADGVPGRERGPYAGEDLLAVLDRVDARREGGQAFPGRPALGGQFAPVPLGRRDEVGGVREGKGVGAGLGAPGPAQVVGVQVGDGDSS
jgi:hypothetical protein